MERSQQNKEGAQNADRNETVEETKNEIFNFLDKFRIYQKVCKFQKKETELCSILLVGEVGSGKSKTGNALFDFYFKEIGQKFDKNYKFESVRSFSSVTKEIQCKIKENLRIIDTPGYNDPNSEYSEFKISSKTCQFLKDNVLYDQGLNAIVQCVQLDKSFRFTKEIVKSISRVLVTFAINCAETQNQDFPLIIVLFNNVSEQIQQEEKEQQNSQSEKQQKIEQDSEDADNSDQDIKINGLIYKQDLINEYKRQLVEVILEDITIENSQINGIQFLDLNQKREKILQNIDKLIPCDNFYCFKITKDKKLMVNEMNIIKKIYEKCSKWGSYILIKQKDEKDELGEVSPIFSSNQIKNLFGQTCLNLIQDILSQLLEFTRKFCQNTLQENQILKIEQIINDTKKMKKEIEDLLFNNAYVFMRIPVCILSAFYNSLKSFQENILWNLQKEYSGQERQKQEEYFKKQEEYYKNQSLQLENIEKKLQQQAQIELKNAKQEGQVPIFIYYFEKFGEALVKFVQPLQQICEMYTSLRICEID
ncbi:P-loop containing nucleoside triphosphate hydrolase [Pseudocohnilembus persalinus]|uniref:p-loop containing nucleoside triphosphate hydrolase n=1 Tax=Pseudocohnilembus persalinus TaxID=266149 RepID=A0A0V0QLR4_PSEPJ|nr:P-loop containing nucleoside triphosphate hydrolase [Pseudocohnilembus persalinus]|eukprot:KRX03267.1 P-loop containing nucleoside triphosphate hydrolase [Pseudocohnilembus persalinus]